MKLFLLFFFVFAAVAWAYLFLKRRVSAAMAEALAEVQQRRAQEYTVRECADWFGKTGLDEATERELAHYLRREFGEYMDDAGSLQAAELEYLGLCEHAGGKAHFWKIPAAQGETESSYAHVETDADGVVSRMGWGELQPRLP